MGYHTEFYGEFTVEPPLNPSEVAFLSKFADTRRMDRSGGPYFVDGDGFAGQGDGPDKVLDHNRPPAGQPGLWCQWVPSPDGTIIEWDGGEKFYESPSWIKYLIEHFLRPDAQASKSNDPQFAEFTFDHVVNGTVEAQGEEPGDRWSLVVKDNKVMVQEFNVVPGDTYNI